MTRTKLQRALMFIVEKIMPKNWKRNQRSHTPLLSLFLPCSTVYNKGIFSVFHCPNKVNNITVNKN